MEIHSGETKYVFAPMPIGPAMEIAIVKFILAETKYVFVPGPIGSALGIAIRNSFWRKKVRLCSHAHWPSLGNGNLKFILAKTSMSLLPCPLAQPWKLKFGIHSGEKNSVFASTPPGPALGIEI